MNRLGRFCSGYKVGFSDGVCSRRPPIRLNQTRSPKRHSPRPALSVVVAFVGLFANRLHAGVWVGLVELNDTARDVEIPPAYHTVAVLNSFPLVFTAMQSRRTARSLR